MPFRTPSPRPPPAAAEEADASLSERLAELAADRGSSAASLVLEAARTLQAWVLERPARWTWEEAGEELEAGLAAFEADQGWRGPCALFLDALRAAWHAGRAREGAPRELVAEELGLWIWGREPGCETLCAQDRAWDGAPFGDGLRLPARAELATHAAARIEAGEIVLVPAPSESVALALEAARRAGRAPRALVGEAAPLLDGHRFARRLSQAGVEVELAPDAALCGALARVDRLWLGAEALGVEGLVARLGACVLLEEAERREVPRLCLATSDKIIPGGELALPGWCEREPEWLWEDAPGEVRLATQLYELVPHALAPRLLTERGPESFAQLSLRALRVERAPRCGADLEHGPEPGIAAEHERARVPARARGAQTEHEQPE
jgi:hypothetical protein